MLDLWCSVAIGKGTNRLTFVAWLVILPWFTGSHRYSTDIALSVCNVSARKLGCNGNGTCC
jgi:hypothetical protein